MAEPDVLDTMRAEWNERAREDAKYYVAFGRREQDDEEFFRTGADVMRELRLEFKRLPGRRRALEIGCGPGRLMRPMASHFEEVHGVDVSDEMVALARQKLRGVPNAFAQHAGGSDLAAFQDDHFDLVYSYAVFQHIPSREVVFRYLQEARRVLRPGGILKCQINGLPQTAARYTTWDGVRVSGDEVKQFAREQGMLLLALEGEQTQYMWVTLRKRSSTSIRAISNAYSGEAAVPAEGRFAAASLWVDRLPDDADLNNLAVAMDGAPGVITYVGPAGDLSQINARLPQPVRTGMIPVDLRMHGESLAPRSWMRVIRPGPAVPRIVALSDGVNLLSTQKVSSGSVKLAIEELADPQELRLALDQTPITRYEQFCTDPVAQRYEFNFDLPPGLSRGWHHVYVHVGRRAFVPAPVEVD